MYSALVTDKRGSKWFKYALGAGSCFIMVFLIPGVIFFIHQRRMKKKYDPSTLLSRSISYDPCGTTGLEAFVRNYGPLSLNRYKFSDVKKFTNSFKQATSSFPLKLVAAKTFAPATTTISNCCGEVNHINW
nr:hypothetical protein CFP56_54100 [Quercus suber]